VSIKDEPWFKEPFKWYEIEGKPEIVGIQLTETVALDFMQGLYDIYKLLLRNNREQAVADTETLAVLLLASAYDYGQQVIEELITEEFSNTDLDAAFAKLVEEDNA
jgi:hypothetical protein